MSGFLDDSVRVYLKNWKLACFITRIILFETPFFRYLSMCLKSDAGSLPTFLKNVRQFSNQNVLQRGIAVDCWQYIYPYEIWKWFVKRLIFYQKLGLLSKQIKISEGSNFSLKFYACVLLRNAYKKVLRKLYFFWIGRS